MGTDFFVSVVREIDHSVCALTCCSWIDVGWNTGGAFGGNYAMPIEDSVDEHWWPKSSLAPVFHAAHTAARNINTVL